MRPKDIVAEVTAGVSPHGVNVGGVVLDAVVLNQEIRIVDAVIVRLMPFG